MSSALATTEAPWIASTSRDSGSSSDSDTSSIEPVVEYILESNDGLVHPKMGEGFTTRKGKDYRAKSTWYLKSWSQRTMSERVLGLLYRPEMESQYFIKDIDRGPIPRGNLVFDNAFIFTSGMLPIVIQSAAYWAYPGAHLYVQSLLRYAYHNESPLCRDSMAPLVSLGRV